MTYKASDKRYSSMKYNRCGNSGLFLPSISLGLWHNFGGVDQYQTGRDIVLAAFDNGVTHIDLANNYGPPPGSAEENFGRILKNDLKSYRDELIISTKAGYGMWDGPYGDFGSRKYLISSCDQSLKRMGLEYVDIFYHHRPDPHTPIEETMGALVQLYNQGKTLYVGISNYNAQQTAQAVAILKEHKVPCLINQYKFSMLDRWSERDGLLSELQKNGVGSIVFSPLAQGLLTDRYANGIPENSRAAKVHGFLHKGDVENEANMYRVSELQKIAQNRGQSLAQMALAWLLNKGITSVLIGASSVKQLLDNIDAQKNTSFSSEEINKIENILK